MNIEAKRPHPERKVLRPLDLEAATVPQIAGHIDRQIAQLQTQEPGVGILTILQHLSDTLPGYISAPTQNKVAAAAISDRPELKAAGQKALVFLHSRTILAASSPLFSTQDEYNEMLVQEGITHLLEHFDGPDTHRGTTVKVRNLVLRGIAQMVAAEEGYGVATVRSHKHFALRKAVDQQFAQTPQGINDPEVIERIAQSTGLDFTTVRAYITYRNKDIETTGNPNTTEDIAMQHSLRTRLIELLKELPEIEREVIARIYGFMGQQETIKDIAEDRGVTEARIVQTQRNGFEKLKHPSKSDRVRDFLR